MYRVVGMVYVVHVVCLVYLVGREEGEMCGTCGAGPVCLIYGFVLFRLWFELDLPENPNKQTQQRITALVPNAALVGRGRGRVCRLLGCDAHACDLGGGAARCFVITGLYGHVPQSFMAGAGILAGHLRGICGDESH